MTVYIPYRKCTTFISIKRTIITSFKSTTLISIERTVITSIERTVRKSNKITIIIGFEITKKTSLESTIPTSIKRTVLVDHVRTQLPYAMSVAVIAILFGYLPSGYNVPSVVSLLACTAAAFGLIRLLGKREQSHVG